MAYYSVEEAVTSYVERYETIQKAILKAQVQKNTAHNKGRFLFWEAVENELKKLKPQKKSKWEQEETE